ncbi:hypothetical protein [Congregibacter litoralis]|uniref:Uncharacterized protein n=1 Tax=Congregibacter litoralis KT71 TaxID=314285 RepID=A4AD59_9GAMM|nr:hypothetical protein [Congregibacter litoralis]EAQ96112.1 hypothetical protein KT71_08650 [Congregibacter litoralis KT71]
MHEDKELEGLESLYKQVMPEAPIFISEEEDQQILNVARSHLDRSDKTKVVSIAQYRRARVAWSGLSIAAGLLIGIMLNITSEPDSSTASPINEQMLYMGDGPQRTQVALDDLDASELQTLIAELVLRGEIDNADALLDYFRSRYPDFSATE